MPRVSDMPGCRNCPLYQDGSQPFVPDEVVNGASVYICGQNPGQEESEQGRPFVGATGQTMEKGFFPLAGLERGVNVSIGNAIRCRWHSTNNLPPLGRAGHLAERALEHCRNAHLSIPASTRLIVAQGEFALQSLTSETGISDWRGWLLPQDPEHEHSTLAEVYTPPPTARGSHAPVLAVMHLAALFHDPALRVPMQSDWQKVRRFLARTWPEQVPEIITTPPSPRWPSVCAFDTEYAVDYYGSGKHKLVRYSLATPKREVYVVEAHYLQRYAVKSPVQVVMQNAPSDLGFLFQMVSPEMVREEDTMYAHAVLWTGASDNDDEAGSKARGMPHSLDFLASIYGSINRSKHLAEANPILYSGMDALITWDVWRGLQHELALDSQSKWVYEHSVRPLARIIWKAHEYGLRVNQTRVRAIGIELRQEAEQATLRAQAAVGFPLNLGSSKQVGDWLFGVEGLKAPRRGR